MQDFKFDIENNDIVFDTDMVIIDSCSVQNGTLIFMKSVASIDNPSIGVGFQEVSYKRESERSYRISCTSRESNIK